MSGSQLGFAFGTFAYGDADYVDDVDYSVDLDARDAEAELSASLAISPAREGRPAREDEEERGDVSEPAADAKPVHAEAVTVIDRWRAHVESLRGQALNASLSEQGSIAEDPIVSVRVVDATRRAVEALGLEWFDAARPSPFRHLRSTTGPGDDFTDFMNVVCVLVHGEDEPRFIALERLGLSLPAVVDLHGEHVTALDAAGESLKCAS